MNIWMIGKNSMKYYYLRKKIFIVTEIWKILLMQITPMQKKFVKILKKKNLERYDDLYVQIDTFWLPDVFENFRNMCLEIYKINPAKSLSVPGLAWKVDLKKTKVKLNLLTDIDMLLVMEKGIRGGICHSVY